MGDSSRSGRAAGRSGSATERQWPSPPSSPSSPSAAAGLPGSVGEHSHWTVAAVLRPANARVWDDLPGLDLPAMLAAAGIELTVRGADKLMVRVTVEGTSAEDAEARAEQKLHDVP